MSNKTILVQWCENYKSELSELFIQKMSNEEFFKFIRFKLPKEYLRTLRDSFYEIGDEKRLELISWIQLLRKNK